MSLPSPLAPAASGQRAVTIDSAVYVSDAISTELSHADSKRFLAQVEQQSVVVFNPLLSPIEVAAALIRRTGNAAATNRIVSALRQYEELRLVSLTETRAFAAQQMAIQTRLRGADSVYAATAQEFSTTLVTWDIEVISRAGSLVSVMTPTEWLGQNVPRTP